MVILLGISGVFVCVGAGIFPYISPEIWQPQGRATAISTACREAKPVNSETIRPRGVMRGTRAPQS